MGEADDTGRYSEILVEHLLSRYNLPTGDMAFHSQRLGDKNPLFDMHVRLVGRGHPAPFFFAQVKGTKRRPTSNNRLRIDMSAMDARRIADFPIPTYLIGVDVLANRAFVCTIPPGRVSRISSISTAHELNDITLAALYDEVATYWARCLAARHPSRFLDRGLRHDTP